MSTRGLLSLAALAVCSCASAQQKPFAPLDEQFRHRVPFELGHTETTDGNEIAIDGLWGTRPTLQVGGSYIVTGSYKLASADQGKLVFWQTAKNWNNSGPTLDTQLTRVQKGAGRFTLSHAMRGPGYFHLVLMTDDRREVADVYFGHGDSLLKKKTW